MTLFDSISLIAASILLLFFSESTILFQTATLVGTAVTIHMFFRMIKDPNLVRFGNMACFSILLGYAGSTGIYTILNFAYYAGFDYTINEFWLSYSQISISHALLFVFIVSVLLSAIAHFEKPLCISDYLEGSLSAQSLWLVRAGGNTGALSEYRPEKAPALGEKRCTSKTLDRVVALVATDTAPRVVRVVVSTAIKLAVADKVGTATVACT